MQTIDKVIGVGIVEEWEGEEWEQYNVYLRVETTCYDLTNTFANSFSLVLICNKK